MESAPAGPAEPPPVPETGPELVRDLQERTARALPPERVVDLAGWWLRYAPDSFWWVGTVLPHAPAGPEELVRRVAEVEEFYARHGAVTRFQISPGAAPPELDPLLAARGYRRESPMSLQVATTGEVRHRLRDGAGGRLRVELDERPSPAWLDLWRVVRGGDAPGARAILDRVAQPSAYAWAILDRDVVAVGRAVADTGWAGVFGMATLPPARGLGAARCLLAGLAGWAADRRAGRMYLQVEVDNLPALRLYARAGFRPLCGYHYRAGGMRPTGAAGGRPG